MNRISRFLLFLQLFSGFCDISEGNDAFYLFTGEDCGLLPLDEGADVRVW